MPGPDDKRRAQDELAARPLGAGLRALLDRLQYSDMVVQQMTPIEQDKNVPRKTPRKTGA